MLQQKHSYIKKLNMYKKKKRKKEGKEFALINGGENIIACREELKQNETLVNKHASFQKQLGEGI